MASMMSAMRELVALEKKNGVLLNGNFAPIAKRNGVKVRELHKVYDEWKEKGYYIFVGGK